jgi:lysozyme family protein
MAAEDFDEALRVTLIEEGGNDDDLADHGGRTSRGITEREWLIYRRTRPSLPEDVWKAPQSAVVDIYKTSYWDPYCDGMPAGIDMCFFDYSVNAGRTQAVRDLQRVLGIRVDGMFGMATAETLKGVNDIAGLIGRYSDRRRAFYRALRQYPRYGADWIRRTKHIEVAALKMAGENVDETALAKASANRVSELDDNPAITVSPKADPNDVQEPTVTPETGVVLTGGAGTASGGLAGMFDQLHDQLAPFAEPIAILQYVLMAITVCAFGLTLYGFWKRAKIRRQV